MPNYFTREAKTIENCHFFPGLRQTGPKKHQTRIPMSRTGIRETLALTLLDLGALSPRRKDLSPPQKKLRARGSTDTRRGVRATT